VFKIQELPHETFRRNGNDLIYTAKITLLQALMGESLTLTTLDSRKLFVSIDEIINPKTVRKVAGEGMPLGPEAGAKRGDLCVKFDIAFPEEIDIEHKDKLREILKP
jgi:DnaJ family protein B protein 4